MAIKATDFLEETEKIKQESTKKVGASFLSDSSLEYMNFKNQREEDLLRQEYEMRSQNRGGILGGLGYTVGKVGTGAFGIIEGIWDFTAGGLADLFGADEWAEQQFANNIAGDWNQRLDELYNPSKGWQVAGDVASGIGNSLVGVGAIAGAAAITALSGGTLAPAAAGIIAGVTVGLGAAGMSTAEAYKKTGELGLKEYGYGALSGVTEGALEGLTGAAGKVGAKLFAKQTAKTVAKKTVLKGMVSNFAGEAFEEGMSEILDPYFQRWTQVDPEAKNATIQQVGYAALVGGLSGALLGGIGDTYSTVKQINRGNKIAQNQDNTNAILGMARNFAQYESDHNTGKEAYQHITSLVNQFDALDKGDGTLTIGQKKLLGQMEAADVVLALEPSVQRSKENIIANAEAFVEAVNARQMTDGATGKPIHFDSVEALLSDDSLLTQFAVMDSLGQIMLSKDSVYDLVAERGRSEGIMQADFRNFQKEASIEEKKSINELFGIDVDSIAYEDFIDKIQNTNRQVFKNKTAAMQARKQAKTAIANAINTKAEVAALDSNSAFSEGMNVFKVTDGKYIAISKQGGQYYLYSDGKISNPLSEAKLKEVIKALDGGQATENKANQATVKPKKQVKKAAEKTVAVKTADSAKKTVKRSVETAKSETKAEPSENKAATEKTTEKPKEMAKTAETKTEGKKVSAKESENVSKTEKSVVQNVESEQAAAPATAKAEPAKKQSAKAPKTVTARKNIIKLTLYKDVRDMVRGAATKDGKQYVSDGFFAARFNDVMQGVTEANAETYPFATFDRIIDENATATDDELVKINADEIRSLAPTKKSEYINSVMRIGNNMYQIAYVSKLLDCIESPQVYLKKKGRNNPIYIKGKNGEAVFLPMRNNSGRVKPVYEVDYANYSAADVEQAAKERAKQQQKFNEKQEKVRAQQEADNKKRQEEYENRRKEEKQKNIELVASAEKAIADGELVENKQVNVYADKSDLDGKESCIFTALLDKYDVKVPIKTRGWIIENMKTAKRLGGEGATWHIQFKKGATASKSITPIMEKLYQAITGAKQETTAATAKNESETTRSLKGKSYGDFTVEEFKALPKSLQGYYLAKDKKPNAIVMVQLGDFYEMFADDAVKTAKELDLTLTGRRIKGYEERVELTGIPYSQFEKYKNTLTEKGYDVVSVNSDGRKVLYKAKGSETVAKKSAAESEKVSKTKKTDDFGEKIGGARKDTWQKVGLRTTNLVVMNGRELETHVKKENVWKRPDYVKAVADGGDRGLLYAQNELYKSLNAKPVVSRDIVKDTESAAFRQAMEVYVYEVGEIQKLAESVTSAEDLDKIKSWLIEQGYVKERENVSYGLKLTDKYYFSPAFRGSNLLGTINALKKSFDALSETALLEGFGVEKSEKLPKGYTIRRIDSFWDNSGVKYVILKGGRYVSNYFASYEDALAYGKEKFGTAENAPVSKDGKKRYVPEQLKDVHRNGLDYRKGKEATGDDFLRDFGIKGGEFGNWLSEADRTTSLNYGYDAFCDLADALDIELTDISLNGTLSIGFGSRGQGLSGAAAHYEPARKVINLTKMNGAGSLAHEWWHAIEDYTSGDTHQSDMASDFSKMPEKTKQAGKELLNAINYKNTVVGLDEINENRAKSFERSQRILTHYFDTNFKIFSEDLTAEQRANEAKMYRYKRTPTDADIAEYKELRERAFKGEAGIANKVYYGGGQTVVDDLNALLKDVKGRGIQKEDRQSIANLIENLASFSEKATETQTKRIKTKFHEDAIAISQNYAKDGGYWDSNCEMLARAFASYIADKTGQANGYLSGHAYGAVPVVKGGRDSKIEIAYIYPHDAEERKVINNAFDKFFSAAKEDGLIHQATRQKPTTKIQYAVSEEKELNTTPNGSKSQKLAPLQMKRAETYAQKNIKGFDSLTEAEKLEVEWTLASGWRYGVETEQVLSLAKLSAAIGTGVGFADLSAQTPDGKTVAPDAACYTRGGHLTIYLNPNSKRTVECATLHELTHSMEGMQGYRELQKMAEDYYAKNPDKKAEIDNAYRKLYEKEQVRYAEEILPSELTSHYIETMLEKRNVLAELTKEQPTFMQKCIEKLKAIRNKLSGESKQTVSDLDLLVNKFVSTFNLNKGKIANKGKITDRRLSIVSVDGKQTVVVDTDQHIFDGVSRADMGATVRKYMKERYRGRIVNGTVFARASELEYTHSRDSHRLFNQTNSAYEAKMRASTELNNLILTGEFIGQETAKHPRVLNEGGFKRYKSTFVLDNKVFNGELIIAIDKNGVATFYDMVKVKESDSSNINHNVEVRTNAPFDNSIADSAGNVNADGKSFALDMIKKQDKTSAATSINSAKIPALYGKVKFDAGTINLDIGGGKFDNVTEYLKGKGVTNYIYDPYNRSAEHNSKVAKLTEEGKSDTVTISNVLNVIDSLDGRQQVLNNAVDAVKPNGTVYITVYEGDGSGSARITGKDQFQLNRKTTEYVEEVQEYFDDVTVKNKVIIAKSPKKEVGTRYTLSDIDSQGHKLSSEQREYFKDSKIVDKNGNLLVVYHGTLADNLTWFNPKMVGTRYSYDERGFFFIDRESIARDYASSEFNSEKKGVVIPAYILGKKPLVIDSKYLQRNGYPRNALTENDCIGFWDIFQSAILDDFDAAKADSIVIDDGMSKMVVAFNSNQIKRIDNLNPTRNKDIRYALPETDSSGKKLTEQQRTFFADSKVVDEQGRLLEVYHGTNNEFYTFDKNRLGTGTDQFGAGYYFATDKNNAENYGKRVINAYLNIKNPFEIKMTRSGGGIDQFYSHKITEQQAYRILKEHPLLLDGEDSPLGNYSERYWEEGTTDSVVREVASQMTEIGLLADNTMFGHYQNEFNSAIKKVLHYDGIKVDLGNSEYYYIAWSENQIKLTTNKKPTADTDIRYALKPEDVKGSDKVLTSLPDDKISFRDVVSRKKTVTELKEQVDNDSKYFKEGWQIATTNAQAGLERVLRETGNKEATAITNYVRAGKNAAYAALTVGQFSLDGEVRLGESWQKIWQPVYNMDKRDGQAHKMFELYLLHWHNTDRYAVGKPVFGNDVTVADSFKAIEEIEAQYPTFRKIAEKVWKFNDNNLQIAVDSGIYSAEYAETLREMYPHYVPTLRAEHQKGIATIQGKNNVRVNPNKKKATGSDLEILPIDDTVAQQTIQRLASARVNEMLLKIMDGAEHEEFRIIGSESATADIDSDNLVTTFQDKAKGLHQVTFWKDGKSVTAEVSQNVYRGIESFMPSGDTTFNNAIIGAVAKVNSTIKKLVTAWNPFFVFYKNPIRDLQTALNYTRYSWKEYSKNFKRAASEIANNGKYWQEAQAAGILSASVYDYRKGLQYKKEATGLKATWGKVTSKLESASNAIEMAPRLAEYISARESGLSVQEALLQAQDLTTNFGRSGTLTKKLNATFMPFLNPAVQGFSKMVRAYTGKDAAKSWINLIIRSVILGIGATALNDLLNDDDEDYQNLSDYVKQSNYVLALGDGQFLKIPKGRENGFIGELYLRAKRSANGDANAWEGVFESFISNLTPTDNFTRTIFSPFVDISTNSTWYGGTIEGQKWNDTEPKSRYDESTSSIAIWLGKVFNYSPIKIDYLLEQYGGIVADVLLPATNLEAENGVFSQNMLVDSTTNSRWSTEFYSQLEKYTYKKTAGDNSAKGVVRYLNSINSTISKMYQQKREIQADKTLSKDEKLTQVKIVQAAINALEKDALSNAQILYSELEKYDLSDDRFEQSYLDAVSVVIGEEYALKVYNSQVYDKAVKLNSLGISYGTYYDYYFAVKDISADKSESGITISGSKKEKVIRFTMAQDIPTVQKLVLIMSAGYKIADGDIKGISAKAARSAVAQYITKQKLTREEKTALAEMCGFTVKNGKIYTY